MFFKEKPVWLGDHLWPEVAGGKQSPTGAPTYKMGEEPWRAKSMMGTPAGAKGR